MKSTSRAECAICAEKHTEKNTVICVYCKYEACRTCVRTYVLNETTPKCMNCNKPWTREHQNALLKPIFVNGELKKHLEQVMFDRERAQFPETMSRIEDIRLSQLLSHERTILFSEIDVLKARRHLETTKIQEAHALKSVVTRAQKMHPDMTKEMLEDRIEECEKERDRLFRNHLLKTRRLAYINRLLTMPLAERRAAIDHQIDGADPEEIIHTLNTMGGATKRHFVRACPIESCRGFLSTQWKCGLCETHTCPTCHVPKDSAEHTCNPDDVATAELLAKDTRPCPKCGTGIFKIDGCDQMWCIECHSAFSWKTGRLETGNVHNPHFFEYQRRIGVNMRNAMDLPCGELPEHYHGVLYNLVGRVFPNEYQRYSKKRDLIEMEIRDKTSDAAMSLPYFVELQTRYRQDEIPDNQDLRVKYLTEEIDEAQFRSSLFRDAKKFNVEREMGQVIQTVVFAMTDILNRLIEYLNSHTEENTIPHTAEPSMMLSIISEVGPLMDYANECLAKICIEYKITRVGLFLRDRLQRRAGIYSVKVVRQDDGTERIIPTTYRG